MYNLMRWVGTTGVTAELAAKIDAKYQQGKEYYKQGQAQGKTIATGPPLFRMFPRDLAAEEEWKYKRDKMALSEQKWATTMDYVELKELKEKIDWELFVSDWGQVYSLWNELPARDERPDEAISGEEDDYWKLLAIHYWEASWMRFNELVVKYAGLPVIAERALDFLGSSGRSPSCKNCKATGNIIGYLWCPKHPLAGKRCRALGKTQDTV